MADQTFGVNCGFWDAINFDRTYSADDMNKPYSRLVADGVFAANEGSPSSDLQVSAAGTNMNITVQKGQGIFAHKWFENPSSMLITVPDNTALYSRIDSVIAQVDKRTSGRVGNIVYRTGAPAAAPEAPALSSDPSIVEYRLANITVIAAATLITQADITDLRGSEECPWVTALIQQVSTSTLWAQFQAAYESQYRQYTSDYLEYVEQQRQAWEDFLSTLTDELTVSTNVVSFTSVYTSTGTVSNVPIGIASYAPASDVLQVYINGLLATPEEDYSLNEDEISIDLTEDLETSQTVVFVVFKSLIGANIESAVSLIERLDTKINEFVEDSGWIPLRLEGDVVAASSSLTPAVRAIGDRIYLRGSVRGVTAAQTLISVLPVSCTPGANITYTSAAVTALGAVNPVVITVESAGGYLKVTAVGTISATDSISIACAFLSNYSNDTSMIYRYLGSVNVYADLPDDAIAGDVYMVLTDDPAHFISAGDSVLWNGAEWEIVSAAISSAQIDSIIDSIT